MKYKAYIGTYSKQGSKGIYLVETDSLTGELKELDAYEAQNPSYLAISKDKKHLYCVLETSKTDGKYGGGAASFRIKEDGTLKFLSKAHTGGTSPCHLTAGSDDRFLYIANYSDGTLTTLPLNNGVIEDEPDIIAHKGKGPNEMRQEGPHIHCAVLCEGGKSLCVADLGLDRIDFYNISEGKPVEGRVAATDPGAGPRHAVFSADGQYMWVVCELSNEVYAFDTGTLSKIGVYKSLPEDFEGRSTCAAIKLSPDGRFICASNRGHDSIAVYKINEGSGELSLVEIYKLKGKTPRDIAFSPDGRFLYSADEDSGMIEALRFADGHLEDAGYSIDIPAACCIVFLED